MANDVSELQTNIIRDLARSETSLSDIVLIDIVSAVREYEAQRFFFNEQTLGPVTLSATNTYAFSLWAPGSSASTASDIIEIDSFRVNLSSRSYTLSQETYEFLDDIDEQSTSTSGYPQYFAVYNRSIRIYPIPQQSVAMTATISAHVKFPDLALTTDSNVWTNEAKDLIRFAAGKRLQGVRYQNQDMAQSYAMAEQLALQALQRRTSGVSGNRIRSVL